MREEKSGFCGVLSFTEHQTLLMIKGEEECAIFVYASSEHEDFSLLLETKCTPFNQTHFCASKNLMHSNFCIYNAKHMLLLSYGKNALDLDYVLQKAWQKDNEIKNSALCAQPCKPAPTFSACKKYKIKKAKKPTSNFLSPSFVELKENSQRKALDTLPPYVYKGKSAQFKTYFNTFLPFGLSLPLSYRCVQVKNNKDTPYVIGRYADAFGKVTGMLLAWKTHREIPVKNSKILYDYKGEKYIATFHMDGD